MKVGDKLFCINDLYIEGGKPKDTIITSGDSERKFDDGVCDTTMCCDYKCKCPYMTRRLLTKGKIYTISSMLFNLMLVENDENYRLEFSDFDPRFSFSKTTYIFSKYFITEKEIRKRKLEDLNDTNFNNFLKGLKK